MHIEPLHVDHDGGLDAELTLPRAAPVALLVLAHGAGAGYRHANLLAISEALADRGVASLRFNFPFMQAGRRRVDGKNVAMAAIAAAAAQGVRRLPGVPLYLGGHSFGGRMTTHAVVEGAVAASHVLPVGLVLLSFPLHPAGRPGVQRAEHLSDIHRPMLFLSGTRDALAVSGLLKEVVTGLESARLHWLEDADHGYRVRKRVRQDPRSVFEEIAEEVVGFVTG